MSWEEETSAAVKCCLVLIARQWAIISHFVIYEYKVIRYLLENTQIQNILLQVYDGWVEACHYGVN